MKLISTNASAKEFYAILGLPVTATPEQIHAAFLNICRTHHPDLRGETEFFSKAKQAHDLLMDPQKRAIYDETGLDPEDTANKITVAALGLIRNIAAGILGDGNVDIDIVNRINTQLSLELTGATATLRKLETKISKSEKMLANIEKRWKKGARQAKNAIAGMVASQIEQAKTERCPVERSIEVVNLAVELLRDAEWESDGGFRQTYATYGIDPTVSVFGGYKFR